MAGKSMGPKKKAMAASKEPTTTYVCPHCGKTKKVSEFYVSTDPAVTIGIAFPCKDCAENIARRYDPKTGEYSDMTEASLKSALMYLDKPFIRKLWETAYNEVHNEALKQPKKNMWTSYIKNVTSLSQYRGLRWRDGDFEETKVVEEIHSDTLLFHRILKFSRSVKRIVKILLDLSGTILLKRKQQRISLFCMLS